MTSRILMSALVATLVLGTTTAAVRAGDEPSRQRAGEAETTIQPLDAQEQRLRVGRAERVQPLRRTLLARCNTLQCINKTFKKIKRNFNALVGAHNALVDSVNALGTAHNSLQSLVLDCFGTLGVTQWGDPFAGTFGYMWDSNGDEVVDFDTSALDLDDPDFSDFLMLAYAC